MPFMALTSKTEMASSMDVISWAVPEISSALRDVSTCTTPPNDTIGSRMRFISVAARAPHRHDLDRVPDLLAAIRATEPRPIAA